MSAVIDPTEKPRRRKRRGNAVCLSGGGFRATLFHLGAMRRLNELGLLIGIRSISSVSGGSIISAKLATALPWPLQTPVPPDRWDALITRPIRDFTRRNRRTGPILSRLWPPKNWTKEDAGVTALAEVYERELTNAHLSDLPVEPEFTVCATDMAFGVSWIFTRESMGSYKAGYIEPPPADWPLARAVAASSCFPPVFNPMRVGVPPGRYKRGKHPAGKVRDECLSDLRLTDGGDYDNMGLEPVWSDHKIVLVSDGGGLFDPRPDTGLMSRVRRYSAIVENQAHALRLRMLFSDFSRPQLPDGPDTYRGAYWGIGTATTDYPDTPGPGYTKELVREFIAPIRTDLDAFTDGEAAVLQNHGYLLVDTAIRTRVPQILPTTVPTLNVPFQDWMDEDRARLALRDSSKTKLF